MARLARNLMMIISARLVDVMLRKAGIRYRVVALACKIQYCYISSSLIIVSEDLLYLEKLIFFSLVIILIIGQSVLDDSHKLL